jgi:hypothetical protein
MGGMEQTDEHASRPAVPKPKTEKNVTEPIKPPVAHIPVNKEAKKQLQKQEKLVRQLEEDIKRLQENATGWSRIVSSGNLF